MPAQIVSIPIDRVEPHPKLMLRFTYDVASLADLIKSAADENAPNGQLEPGRVVPKSDGKSYFVYIGVRRYLALRKLFEKTHDSRYFTYNAYVDSGLTELQMFVRAKMENEEEKGERQGLSVLEEVFGLNKIRDSVSKEKKLDSDLKREFDVAVKLGEEKVRKLFQIESAAHFRFRLGHLERLGAIEDEREFYLSAACIAAFDLGVDRVDEAVQGKDAAYTLDWFRRLFPELKEPEKGSSAASSQPTVSSAKEKGQEDVDQPDEDEPLEVHEEEVLLLRCPACENENILLLRLKAEVTRLPRDPRAKFMDGSMRRSIVGGAASLFLAVSAVYFLAFYLGRGLLEAQTMAFGTWMICHVLLALNMRTDRETVSSVGYLSNRPMLVWALAAVLALLAVVYVPWLQGAMRTTSLSAADWGIIAVASVVATFWMEGAKLVSRGDRKSDIVSLW